MDFEKVVQIATIMETSERDATQLRSTPALVEQLGERSSTRKKPSTARKKTNTGYRSSSKYNHNGNNSRLADKNIVCFRCGKGHLATECTLNRNIRCKACGVLGHLRVVCFKHKEQGTSNKAPISHAEQCSNLRDTIPEAEHPNCRRKFYATLEVNHKHVRFEVDCRAAVTIMNKNQALKLFDSATINQTDL